MEKIILIGAGGYAKSVIDALSLYNHHIEGFIDDFKEGEHLGYKILGRCIEDIFEPYAYKYFISIGDNKKRKSWYDILKSKGLELINIIDRTAIVSNNVKIGTGCFIGKMAIINSDVVIGDNCIINTKALVEHGCRIGNHVNLSTNLVLNGDVRVKDSAFVGSCSVVNGQLLIGKRAIVGSGAVVIRNVEDNSTVVGVPARKIQERRHKMSKVYIVAEIGCNHNGDVNLAKKMVKEAKACGVDAVKFQTFDSKELISKYAPKAEYQKITTDKNESQLEMTRKLELSPIDYLMLREYALSLGLDTFSTPFDMRSIEFLHEAGQTVWKIPSGEITNVPYLEKIRDIECENKEIILSTGMSTIEEIEFAVSILKDSVNTKLTILHCNTEYPTSDEDVNLRAILELKERFPQYQIGLSDHSIGIIAAITAVAYEVAFIEKHFTLDKNFYGPDHKASATPNELRELCESVRRAEVMLGSKEKQVTPSEAKNKSIARKSIVARKAIHKGQTLNEDNITCKRPGNGISPINWYKVIGQVAERDFEEDELITLSNIPWEE